MSMFWNRTLRVLCTGAAALVVAACGGGGSDGSAGGDGSPLAGGDPPGSATVGGAAQVQAVTITGVNGAQLVVPPNALEQPVTVRIAADSTGAPPLPAGLQAAGPIYALTPHGSVFAQPVQVRIPKPSTPPLADQQLTLAKASVGGEWEVLGEAQEVDGMLVAPIDSFSFVLPVLIRQVGVVQPWQATVSMECAGQDCNALVGPSAVTLRVTTNGGLLPPGCGPLARVSVLVRERRYSFGLNGSQVVRNPSLSASLGGTYTQTWGDFLGDPIVAVTMEARLVCESAPTLYLASRTARWRTVPSHAAQPVRISAPDLSAGSRATATAILMGGANGIANSGSVRYPFVPTVDNTATVEWERSDDGGASWRTEATSYQYMAEPLPFGAGGLPWYYWRVQHEFAASAAASGSIKFRVRACIDARKHEVVNDRSTGRVVSERTCLFSDVATANVLAQAVLPSFSVLPRSQLVLSGQTASFTAQAAGLPAAALQWQTRPANSSGTWTDLPAAQGGSSPSFTTPPLTLADNGTQYRVVATNSGGSSESPPVTASVSDQAVAPVVTADLSAIRALRGGDATFAVAVRGTEPLNYQWRVGGQVVAGQNAPVLNLQAVQAAATVQVTVSNAAGSVSSRTVDLQVFDGAVPAAPVVIDVQPVSLSIASGQTAVFAVRASGGGSLHYRWFVNGSEIIGVPDSPVLMLPSALPSFSGSYTVEVSNATSSALSNAASLQVAPPVQPVQPAFVVQPVGLSLNPGQTATLAGLARGNGAVSYQWLREGVPILGATQPVLTLPSVAPGDAGNYALRASDAGGATFTSDVAALVVVPAPGAPLIVGQPGSVTVPPGTRVTWAIAVVGTPAPQCQWTRNGIAIPGATSCLDFSSDPVTLADNGAVFNVVAYSPGGVAFGAGAVLAVRSPAAPTIVAEPQDLTVNDGATATFSVSATSDAAMSYAWERVGSGAVGTDNATLGFTASLADQGAQFRVRVCRQPVTDNLCTTSRTATLNVQLPLPAGALTATQAVAGHEWSVVLRPDRTVWGWGWLHKLDGTVQVLNLAPADQARRPVQLYPGSLTDVRQIAGWYDGFWALKGEPGTASSRVLHWGQARSASDGRGSDGAGNLGTVPSLRINAAPVEMLERRSVGGTLQAAPVDHVCSLAATADRVLLIRALDGFGVPTDCNAGSAKTVWVAGTLTPFGSDAVGVVVPVQGLPAGVPARVIAQQATAQSSAGPVLVLMEDGSAFGWGTNIGNLFGLPAPANTGTLGNNTAPQALPASWGVVRDAAFSYVGLIMQRSDGSARVSGRNDGGELGLGPQPTGTVNDGPLPLLAGAGVALDGVQALASTQAQVSLALRQGRILAWGAANQPLQGGSTARIDYPRQLPASGDGWRAISAGHVHAMAIAANGAVYTWGNGVRGALGNGVDGGSALAPTLVSTP